MMNKEKVTTIKLPEAPELPGLQVRTYQGENDFHTIASINQACNKVDRVVRVVDPEYLKTRYTYMPNFNLFEDLVIAELDNEKIGYGNICWWQELDGTRVYEHKSCLVPAWQGEGITYSLLRYHQNRLKKISNDHPRKGRRYFESFAADTEKHKQKILIQDGYKPVRHFFEMVRPDLENIPEVPLPEGLEVREAKPEHYQAIYDAEQEAFRDHWGYSEDAEPPLDAWLEDPVFDPSLWRIAWDGDQVAGMVRSFIDQVENGFYQRKRGWTENISVRRPWRRRGLARALIVQSLYAIKERGMTEAALGVDTDNPQGALKLYKSLRYQQDYQISAYRKPF
jgi:mycothiol synthase